MGKPTVITSVTPMSRREYANSLGKEISEDEDGADDDEGFLFERRGAELVSVDGQDACVFWFPKQLLDNARPAK